MRKVYLDFHGKKHSLYDNLINYPPNGYEFVTGLTSLSKITTPLCHTSFLPNLMMRSANRILPINILKPYIERNHIFPSDIYMVYSSGHILFNKIPWIVDLEFVTHLAGYRLNHFKRYKNAIRRALESETCRGIFPWTDAGKKSVFIAFESETIQEKTETVHLAVPPKKFIKNYNNDKIKILFVGSQNLPKDFEIKGGKEVFETFRILNKKYKNLELVVRSYIPSRLKEKYSKSNKVKIIDQIVPWTVLDKEFKSADIFLFPSHHTPGLAILDAMSYELPVVTTDVWANSEMVKNGQTGILVKPSEKIKYFNADFIPSWGEPKFTEKIRETDAGVIKQLVAAMTILIEDEKLRRNLGKNGRSQIDNGIYSIENRNKNLKKLLDTRAH